MKKQIAIEHRNTDGLSPTSPRLLESPLDFIVEDHLRIRAMCTELETALSTSAISDRAAKGIHVFLTQDLPFLLEDEDTNLLPLLMKRADRDDEVPRLKARLDKEHHELEHRLPGVVKVFAKPSKSWSNDDKTTCHDFISLLRRHLILENAIMLPLARLRLTRNDLEQLRDIMVARRGLGPESDQKEPDDAS